MESRKEVSHSIYETISEIDTRFGEWAKPYDKAFKKERNTLFNRIEKLSAKGRKEDKEATRGELMQMQKVYVRRRRAKFHYLVMSICAKHGRNLDHIVRVAGYKL